MYVFWQRSSLHLTCPRTGPCGERSKTDGAAIWATLWPGFRGFRGFCLPLDGGFKGWWWRPTGAILLYIVMVLDAPSFREYSRQSSVGGKRIGQRTTETSPPQSFRAKPRNLPPPCHLLQWPHSKAHNVLASPCHHSVVGLWMFSNGTMSLQKSIVKPILPPA